MISVSRWRPTWPSEAVYPRRFLLELPGKDPKRLGILKFLGGNSNIFCVHLYFGEDEPILTCAYFSNWVGSTTTKISLKGIDLELLASFGLESFAGLERVDQDTAFVYWKLMTQDMFFLLKLEKRWTQAVEHFFSKEGWLKPPTRMRFGYVDAACCCIGSSWSTVTTMTYTLYKRKSSIAEP